MPNAENAEPQTLDEIREWHSAIVEALVHQRASVLQAIRMGSRVPDRFVGMTGEDIEDHFNRQRRELNRLTVLNFVASAEATIRADYARRVDGRLKDTLAQAYQKWHKTLPAHKQDRPNFDQAGILDILKKTGVVDNHIIGQYRQCLQARHWVGHGRYWKKPVVVDSLDPDDVFNRADVLLKALPP